MSKFLAPIHNWLFNKIKLEQQLEINIVKVHIDNFGEEANKISYEALSLYENYIEEKPLEELIDKNNIHGWLQNKIKQVESRKSYIITSYFNRYGEESRELIKEEYTYQAKQCAKNVQNKTSLPKEVYSSLNNYILCGMPCDKVNTIVESNEKYILFKQNKCIHKENYELGKANLEYMYELRELWVRTFIENLSEKYLYEVWKEESMINNKIIKG